jgi:hypothetical protein
MKRRSLVLLVALAACGTPPPVEQREPCADRNPRRNLYFGDLHVHTALSFDAHMFDVRTTPADAYRFARGAEVALPPLDAEGRGTRTLRIDRPLDFVAVTDHSEFLGEVEACSTPGSDAYDAAPCAEFRQGGNQGVITFGVRTADTAEPSHDPDLCGADGARCSGLAGAVWRRVQEGADGAYDRTAACGFTSFVAYEYSGAPGFSNAHRNVIFRSERVPAPVTFFDQPTAEGLWRQLRAACIEGTPGCDVLAIPHNPNESNGRMFFVESTAPVDEARRRAELRARIEPLVEVYQHKGDSECMNGLAGTIGAPDEACDFEKSPRPMQADCGDDVGSGGVARRGCYSTRDFVRGALLAGLREADRVGVNPHRMGFIASTDTHNGTPGAVAEETFIGHRGLDDDTPERMMGGGALTPGGIEFSPGGLAAVWAEENSRPAIFDALRRREAYGTSGPRIAVRLFAGWDLPADLCDRADLVEIADEQGVPMGGILPARPASSTTGPAIVVSALRDPGTAARPGNRLERIQIVKGWIEEGVAHEEVVDIAGRVDPTAGVDLATCRPTNPTAGADALCAVWRDPNFDPRRRAFYYARVLEEPSCRWNVYRCNALDPAARPPSCTDPAVKRTIQERAWTSPVWVDP